MHQTTGESTAQSDDHRTGDTVREGRFAILGKLGEGGQGTTFEAIDKSDGRRVTLKRFRVKGASSWKEVELAEREAKVLAHLAHPRLPVYIDHFEESGSLYLVTEHIEGVTVARLRSDGAVSETDVLRFLADAAEALDYLHGRTPPLVHRDIKPSNIIRRPDGSFAIIDFGAVRDRLKITGSTVVGTFGFMAPEQFQGRAMPASDVYAVGATAVAMLSGREPEDLPHKGLAIDVAAALPGVRPALVRALAAMVEPDPDKRAASITPLLAELRLPPKPASPPRDGGDADRRSSAPPFVNAPPRGSKPPADTYGAAESSFDRQVDEAGEEIKRVAAELGQTFLRVVDEVSKGSAEDLKREARRAAELARDEAKRAVKEAKRESRRAHERAREQRRAAHENAMQLHEHARRLEREERAQRKRDRRERQQQRRSGAPLGGPVLLIVLLGLTLAQLAVILGLRVITPVVLYLVSLLFFNSVPGKAMRAAAGQVGEASKRAVAAMGRAKDVVRGRTPVAADAATQVQVKQDPQADPHAPTHVSTITPPGGARIAGDAAEPRARIADDAVAEEEAAAEEEARSRRASKKG